MSSECVRWIMASQITHWYVHSSHLIQAVYLMSAQCCPDINPAANTNECVYSFFMCIKLTSFLMYTKIPRRNRYCSGKRNQSSVWPRKCIVMYYSGVTCHGVIADDLIYQWKQEVPGCANIFSYTLGREYRVMRNRYSRLLFTSEDRLCAKLHVQKQSTNMTSQC